MIIQCCLPATSAYLSVIKEHAGEGHSISHSNAALILKRENMWLFFSPPSSVHKQQFWSLICIPQQHLVTKMPEGGSRNIFSAESSHLAPELPEGMNKYDSCRRPEPGTTLARESSWIHRVLSTRVPYVKCFSTWKCQIHSFQRAAASQRRWQEKTKRRRAQRRGTRTPS